MKYLTFSAACRLVAIAMLLVAVFQDYRLYFLSNDYFVILRWSLCFTGSYLIYVAATTKNYVWVFIAAIMVIFFNPIFPLAITKPTWKILDLIFAVMLVASLFLVGEKIGPKNKNLGSA